MYSCSYNANTETINEKTIDEAPLNVDIFYLEKRITAKNYRLMWILNLRVITHSTINLKNVPRQRVAVRTLPKIQKC